MKILIVLENYFPKIGGVETLFKHLVDALAEEGHEITVITNKGLSGPIHERNTNIHIVRVPFLNRYLFTFLATIPAIYYAIGKDDIHTTSYNAALPAYMAAVLTRKKILITFHEVWGNLWFDLPYMSKFAKRLHYLFEQMILKFNFDQFVGVSKYTADCLIANGIDEKKVSHIYNGILYEEFEPMETPIENDKFTISFFARLGISKGIDILLDAIELLDHDDRFHFNLIIPKEPKSMLDLIMDKVNKNGTNDQISFYHLLSFDELKQRIQSSDAVVVPSYSEGFCFSAVESVAMGVPVISSGKGALKEVISGKYIELEALNAEALKAAFIAAHDGHWSTKEMKRFPLKDKVGQYIDLYHQIIQS